MNPRRVVPPTLTRQEVADIAGLSYDTVRRNEERLGLQRVSVNSRVILYYEDSVIAALAAAGYRVVELSGTA